MKNNCPKCRAPLIKGAEFCIKCGSKIIDKYPNQDIHQKRNHQPIKKHSLDDKNWIKNLISKRKKNNTIIIALIIAFICIIAIFFIIFTKNGPDNLTNNPADSLFFGEWYPVIPGACSHRAWLSGCIHTRRC